VAALGAAEAPHHSARLEPSHACTDSRTQPKVDLFDLTPGWGVGGEAPAPAPNKQKEVLYCTVIDARHGPNAKPQASVETSLLLQLPTTKLLTTVSKLRLSFSSSTFHTKYPTSHQLTII